jgi:ribosomal protein L22
MGFTRVEHQFSLFGFTPPKRKVPISKERIEEVKRLIKGGDGKNAAIALRNIRERLEDFERRIK